MSVLATMTPREDQAQTAPRQQASDTDAVSVASPSWLEAARANWRLNEDDSPEFVLARKIAAYADLSDALAARGNDPTRYVQRQKPGAQTEAWGRVWTDVEAERRRNPRAFADIPATRDEFEVWAASRKGDRARDIALASKGGLGTAILPGLGFGLLNGFQAENLPFLFMGGGARSASEFVVKQFVAGAQMTAINAPQVARARASMGEAYTSEQLGTDLVMGGAVNAVVGGVATYGPPLLAKALQRARHERPPVVQAAINVMQHAEDVDATNPFERTHTGIDAHLDKLAEATARIEAGRAATNAGADRPAAIAAVPTARPTPAGDQPGTIDAYMRAARRQESGGSDTAANPRSSATGRYQFTDGTWISWYRKVFPSSGLSESDIIARKSDGAAQDTIMRAFTQDNAQWLRGRGEPVTSGNLYVVHHMGQGGARAIFEAAPGAPLAGLLEPRVIAANPHLRTMTAGQFIAWADKRMGGAGEIADAGADLTPIDVPVPPVVRPDALDAVRPQVTFEGQDIPLMQFSPADIGVDAALMQFKSGGDQFGVTERLQGVQQWDPMAAGVVTVWEANDGRRLIADGHQRLGLAKRILAADPAQPVTMNAFVLREADGFTAVDARVLTALKNIGEGTGSAIDAAKVFRDVGLDEGVLSRLPPKSALVRDGKALARLSPEAFGAAINEVIPESYAAAIGHLADDPATHAGLVALLNKIDPPNRSQAESVIRQAMDAGFITEEQFDMFGGSTSVTALFAHKAKALDKALGELRKLKGAFSVAARNADALDAAGNRIDVDASTAAAEGNARALDLVNRLALRKGNAVSAIFNDAAERLAKGEPLASVVRDTVRQLGELDLANVLREAGSADGAGNAAAGSGRGGIADDAFRAAPEPEALTPATRDELEAAGQGGFALFDEEAAKAFDDPAGEGVQAVADSAWHDAKAAIDPNIAARARQEADIAAQQPLDGARATGVAQDPAMPEGLFGGAQEPTFDLGDGKGVRTLADIEAELDADQAAIDAIKGCLL